MAQDNPICFYLGQELKTLSEVPATLTVLNYLRLQENAIGTKEGCAEGDCGACTVVLGELINGQLQYKAVNACILFVPMLDGKQLITVEHLKSFNQGQLHPVQQLLVDTHGSQCGFCTPGFVMSGYALYENTRKAGKINEAWSNLTEQTTDLTNTINKAFAGNLCRCTGYGPIIEAGKQMVQHALNAPQNENAEQDSMTAKLQAIQPSHPKQQHTATQTFIQPHTITDLTQALVDFPEAKLLAGATDLGLWVTKQHRHLPALISVNQVPELQQITLHTTHLEIGAAVTYSQAMPVLCQYFPMLEPYLERHSSTQIRNSGTIVGNIANGSPIADMPPPLMALGATLRLRNAQGVRDLLLQDYFIEYGRQGLQAHEFIESVSIPWLNSAAYFQVYKISKRFEQDISSVSAAFYIELTDQKVSQVRLCFGGMAGTPKRAALAEAALLNQPWQNATLDQAVAALTQDFTPLDDFRASKTYRMTVAQNLLRKFFIETQTTGQPLSLTHTGEIKHA
ncbi:xanthine dehydrogenase small subunit [Thiosulfativibrio zosterae]|uniref:Xanthine dehydrogenase small subunit n=1 Tax=Thiosulfativibrio zosterae TaxID=2675053 RepID=A0A6F8PP86_9GAMM|nr:xanthine dehydrogenase small subunit [Thiosulfativibrio zosterae]BBP43886.1 xanthine dehydrogenase small subunit [Thiosulfativibrio zosterae]